MIHRFKSISIKIPTVYFAEIEKIIIEFIWNCKRPRIDKTTLKNKNEVIGFTLPNFKPYCKTSVNKPV